MPVIAQIVIGDCDDERGHVLAPRRPARLFPRGRFGDSIGVTPGEARLEMQARCSRSPASNITNAGIVLAAAHYCLDRG
jgi:hypothetical protein